MFNLFQIYYFTDIFFFKNSMLKIKNRLVCARYFHPSLLILSKEGIFFFSLFSHGPYQGTTTSTCSLLSVHVAVMIVSGSILGEVKSWWVNQMGVGWDFEARQWGGGLLMERSVGVLPHLYCNYFRSYGA
jgi:hypothetical protein